MANVQPEKAILSYNGKDGLLTAPQTLVADAAVTATLTGVDTGTDMTAAQAATIVTDLTDLKDQLNLVIDVLEAHGLMKDS